VKKVIFKTSSQCLVYRSELHLSFLLNQLWTPVRGYYICIIFSINILALDTLTTKRFFVSYYQQYQHSFCVSWRSGKTQHHPVFKVLCWLAFDSTIKEKNLQIQVPDTNFMKYFMITFYSVLSP